jgi:hypothetical protein
MYFNLQSDTGEAVVGYVVPDSFSGVPRLRVCQDGEELLSFTANEIRSELIAAGRHETGACGFRIDVRMLPDLANLPRLEVFDVESGVLIYRRPSESQINKKILRLETQMFPLWRLDICLQKRFQYFSRGAEQYGKESVTQMFLLDFVKSSYLSARIFFQNFAYYVEKSHFETIALIREPHLELSERLIMLGKFDENQLRSLGMERELLKMRTAIEFAKSIPVDDEKRLLRALRAMPSDVVQVLSNPVVRQLTASTPDEMPKGGAVAAALDCLSSFRIVGLRSEPAEFLDSISEFLGVERTFLPHFPEFTNVIALGRHLKETGVVDAMIEGDCELYHLVTEARAKVDQATPEAGRTLPTHDAVSSSPR